MEPNNNNRDQQDDPPPGGENQGGKKKPAPRRLKEGVEVNTGGKDIETVVGDALEKLADKLTVMQLKPTFAEYIKLLELARDMQIDSARKEIEIKWIGPDETWSDEV